MKDGYDGNSNGYNGYIGVSQIIIEWEDYQDERSVELTFATTKQQNFIATFRHTCEVQVST